MSSARPSQSLYASLRSTLSGIVHSPISDAAWTQATLSFSHGGLSLREACTMTKPLASILLGDILPLDELVFPGELDSTSNLTGPEFDLNSCRSSQSSLQRALDDIGFNYLLADSDIRPPVSHLSQQRN